MKAHPCIPALMCAAVLTCAPASTPASAQASVLADLPLHEVPAGGTGHRFVVFLTGDGGWAPLDEGVTAELTAAGIPVVGFNQRVYLGKAKTPEEAGADLARIIAAYRTRWRRDTVLIIGYSRGAGIAPFAVNRLPPDLRRLVAGIVLIGSEHTAGFHFRLRDLFSSTPSPDDLPLMPELEKLGSIPLLCFYGADESDTICPELRAPAISVKMSGGHHLDGAYGEIGRRILKEMR